MAKWGWMLLVLCCFESLAQTSNPDLRGLWYDRARSGRGLDLTPAGNQLFGTFYTFDAMGQPQWLILQVPQSEAPRGPLLRFVRENERLTRSTAGQFQLREVTACVDGRPRPGATRLLAFDFDLDGQSGSWCLEQLVPPGDPLSVLSGAWYDPLDGGWGVFAHHFRGETFRTVYYHDERGSPRWLFTGGRVQGLTQRLNLFAPYAPCADCPSQFPVAPVGWLELTLRHASPTRGISGNRARVQIDGDGGPVFARDAAIALLSEPVRLTDAASTTEGPVQGELTAEVSSFKNIPFAAAPVFAKRWRAPEPPEPRNTLRLIQGFGPGCLQPPGQGIFTGAPAVQSEDCLQLNIWRPTGNGPYPVMVWIHGGGLVQGAATALQSGVAIYDGSKLAARGVVVVTINYRLGPFGYMALRDVLSESGRAGNDGVLDQIRALTWVRDNIAAFAGDPKQVTIFGESAGGVSTCGLMASPAARGLFARSIVQSGNCLINLPSMSNALEQGDRVSVAAGCHDPATRLACLRTLPAETVLAAGRPIINAGTGATGETYGLILDGQVFAQSPGNAVAGGNAAPVPLLIGVNDDEQTTLTPANTLPSTVAGYEAAIRSMFTQIGSLVLAQYPASNYPTPQAAYQDLLDDLRFTCAARRAAADHAGFGHPSFHYVLTDALPDPTLAPLESFHGLDVILLFGPRAAAAGAERALSDRMSKAWVDFASGRVPGSTDGTPWPAYSASQRQSQELHASRTGTVDDYHGAACSFWNRFLRL